jgi:nucleoid DNA-binding protein
LEELFNASILGHLENGGKVQFMPFYTLSPKARMPRKGRNPRTGDEIQIKGSRYVSFRQGKGLKELMNADQIKVKKLVEETKAERAEKEANKSKKKSATNKKKGKKIA